MRKLILITGLLIALSGMTRSAGAQTAPIVGYGSNSAGEIHLIDLETGTSLSSFVASIDPTGSIGVALQGLAIDTFGTTLYGSDQNGLLYSIDIATKTTSLIGDTVLGGIEAMDFNFNGEELWVTDFDNFPVVKIHSVNTSDASTTLVQTLHPPGFIGGAVRAMTADTTKDVWIANDSFPAMEFRSVDTDILKAPPVTNVTKIGSLDNDTNPFPFPPPATENPKITGMDRATDGVLYGLSNDGGVYIINQDPSIDETTTPRLSLRGNTGGHAWLGLAIATATTTTIAIDIKPNLCPNELKVNVNDDSDSIDGIKVTILGTETFDVNSIDVATIKLNGISPIAPPVAIDYADVTAPSTVPPCGCEVNSPDNQLDLVLYFDKTAIVNTLAEVLPDGTVIPLSDGDEIPLTLIGKLLASGAEIEGTDCVLINTSETSSDDTDCCDGKVTALTLQYTGSNSALIRVKQKKKGSCGITVFSDTVAPGDTFTFTGADDNGTLGTEIRIYVGCRLNTKIHTSCSQPIGPGLVSGNFVVISGTSRIGGALCPVTAPAPYPAPDPNPTPNPGDDGSSDDEDCCKGKVKELTLQYTVSDFISASIVVDQKDGTNVFSGTIEPGNNTFTFAGADNKGTLGTEISIYVDGSLNTTIHTSCSKPIGPGLVSGNFEVISGTSRNGGALCPVSNDGNGNVSDSSSGHKKRKKHRKKHRKSRQHGHKYNRGH